MEQYKDRQDMGRRDFLLKSAAGLGLLGLGTLGFDGLAWAGKDKAISLPPLPYSPSGLAPHISARTMSYHYSKHHAGYVKKTIRLTAGTPYEGMPLIKMIRASHKAGKASVFNNAAQVFNHTFYWHSMKPGGGGKPKGPMLEKLRAGFGSYAKFRAAFAKAAATQFASGWAWLAVKNGKLGIIKSSNAGTPLTQGIRPLLTIDVWEHAYYLDYQNRRGEYIRTYLDNLVNWDFAWRNLNR